MNLTDETAKTLIKSIDELAIEIKNVDRRLQALCERLGNLAGAINPPSGKAK
jgi:hypothetical protein